MAHVNGSLGKKEENLNDFLIFQFFVRVPEIDALQKKSKLLFGDLGGFLLIHRPGELIFLGGRCGCIIVYGTTANAQRAKPSG